MASIQMADREIELSARIDNGRNDEIASAMRMRILNVLSSATYQMEKFLQLTDVVVSDFTETAAVEVGPQPRLHLNKDFVAKHCVRDEHLLMLIMHELYHILLGHTRLYPRVTLAHNIVFDAIINAMLCQQFPESAYVQFFNKLNSPKRFPGRLLRPPVGWLVGKIRFDNSASENERKVMHLLYGEKSTTATYQEIFHLLENELKSQEQAAEGDGHVLLGDHEERNRSGGKDDLALNDAVFKEVMRRVVQEWPKDAIDRMSRGCGTDPRSYLLPKEKSPRQAFLQALTNLIKKVGLQCPVPGAPHTWKISQSDYTFSTVIPNWRDRNAFSHQVLHGSAPMLYRCQGTQLRPRWRPQDISHIYVDVSGSMYNALPWLIAALDPLLRNGICRLYAFSTIIDHVTKDSLRTGKVKSTGGTDIDCVSKHLLGYSANRTPRKVLIITDGVTGEPTKTDIDALKSRKVALYIGIIEGGTIEDLAPYAKYVEILPKFR